jgi:hypothetical protein
LHDHIEESAAIGAPHPSSPVFYHNSNLSQAPAIEVLGPDTSGEVEPVVAAVDNKLHLTVGSDHTDRKAETQGIALFKQLCPKPLGRELWALDDVAGHWDQLKLRSFARKACGLPGWHPVRNAPTERSDRAPWICASGEFTRLTGSSYRCLPSASCTLSHPSRTFSVGGRLPKV